LQFFPQDWASASKPFSFFSSSLTWYTEIYKQHVSDIPIGIDDGVAPTIKSTNTSVSKKLADNFVHH
jgi:hypothetical protein